MNECFHFPIFPVVLRCHTMINLFAGLNDESESPSASPFWPMWKRVGLSSIADITASYSQRCNGGRWRGSGLAPKRVRLSIHSALEQTV